MFPNGEDDIMPLGYLDSETDLESTTPKEFIRNTLEFLVADALTESGYKNVEEPCVEVLSDVLMLEINGISSLVKSRMEKSGSTASQCINKLSPYDN